MTTNALPEQLHAAYDWIDSAGEWDEALADPNYAREAAENAAQHGQHDVTESDLDDVIEWYRKHGVISVDVARRIVVEEFSAADWTEQERPAISDDLQLGDGNYQEPVDLSSENALRAQCRAWIRAGGGEG